jgi:TatA/E family protein of Tat protein translocase
VFGHLPEFFIVLVIGLIVFGPEKLPEVAANVGKVVREVRGAMDSAMHPLDLDAPTDFSTYYYESLARSGEAVEEPEDIQAMEEPFVHVSDEPIDSVDDAHPGAHPINQAEDIGRDAG